MQFEKESLVFDKKGRSEVCGMLDICEKNKQINENTDNINKNVYDKLGGDGMRIDEQLKILAVKTNMTFAEISGKVDKSPQAFSQKMKRGNYTLDELEEIARATGTKITCYFELPNGEMIKLV